MLRKYFQKRFELSWIDIAVAAFVLLVWLVLSGQVEKFIIGNDSLQMEVVLNKLEKNKVEEIISPSSAIPMKVSDMNLRGTAEQIREQRYSETNTLGFVLGGHGGQQYRGKVIKGYVNILTSSGTLEYILVMNKDFSLAGFFTVNDLRKFKPQGTKTGYDFFAEWVNSSDLENISRQKGFVGIGDCLTKKSALIETYERMVEKDFDALPVIDNNNNFIGVTTLKSVQTTIIDAFFSAME